MNKIVINYRYFDWKRYNMEDGKTVQKYYITLPINMVLDGFKLSDGPNKLQGLNTIDFTTIVDLDSFSTSKFWLCEITLRNDEDDEQKITTFHDGGGSTNMIYIVARYSMANPLTYYQFKKPLPKLFRKMQNYTITHNYSYYMNYWPEHIKYTGQEQKYYKVVTASLTHNNYKYSETEMNYLPKDQVFNDNPKDSCCPGRLYITTLPYISEFYHYGVWLYEVILPTNDENFKMVADYEGNKWGVNMLKLGNKFSLLSPHTFAHFDIPQPSIYDLDVDAKTFIELQTYWPKNVKFNGPDVIYYKLAKYSENHEDEYAFKKDERCQGFFRVAKKRDLKQYVGNNDWLYEVTLPVDDPSFTMSYVSDSLYPPIGVNMMTIKKCLSLKDPDVRKELGLEPIRKEEPISAKPYDLMAEHSSVSINMNVPTDYSYLWAGLAFGGLIVAGIAGMRRWMK